MSIKAKKVGSVLVRAGSHSYHAFIGRGLMATAGDLIAEHQRPCRCALITDETVARLWEEKLRESLANSGFEPVVITVSPGEQSKALSVVESISERMSAAGLDRKSCIVALGGGVIGDLGGFVAAVYHRGIPCVQIPTTLLAQVDSSIGGKTAVNTSTGKNLIGAVHHPVVVLADVDTLSTLPPREFHQGFAEIIKHAIIADVSLLDAVENFERKNLAALVRRNVEIKASVVAADQYDVTGARALLNFGHTIGHAIESVSGYARFLHGEAISLGIVAACEISVRKAGLSEEERARVISALEKYGLPTRLPPEISPDAVIEGTRRDKKFARGEVRFILTARLGSAYVASDVTFDDIRDAVAAL